MTTVRKDKRRFIGPKADAVERKQKQMTDAEAFEKDWARSCQSCGAKPVVNATGLCGPCTFGEAETAGGNW